MQRDVPSILDSLLRLHDAMSKLSSSNPDNDIAIEAKTVAEASKSGIQMVANAFYADLRLLDLSSKTREAMQGFVDMAR